MEDVIMNTKTNGIKKQLKNSYGAIFIIFFQIILIWFTFLITSGNESLVYQYSKFAYYILIIGVILSIISFKRNKDIYQKNYTISQNNISSIDQDVQLYLVPIRCQYCLQPIVYRTMAKFCPNCGKHLTRDRIQPADFKEILFQQIRVCQMAILSSDRNIFADSVMMLLGLIPKYAWDNQFLKDIKNSEYLPNTYGAQDQIINETKSVYEQAEKNIQKTTVKKNYDYMNLFHAILDLLHRKGFFLRDKYYEDML